LEGVENIPKEYPQRLRHQPNRYTPEDFLSCVADAYIPGLYPIEVMVREQMQAPQSLKEAVGRPDACQWRMACAAELNGMREKGVFDLVERPKDAQILKSRWVFTQKMGQDGSMTTYKARLVIKGFAQVPGKDYNLTWSPLSSWTTLRTLFAYAAEQDLEMRHGDITQASLNSDAKCSIFVEQPDGFEDGSGHVWLLKKYMYGLKQASREWNQTMSQHLGTLGMHCGESDASLYVSRVQNPGGVKTLLALWVDDFFTVGSPEGLDRVMSGTLSRFVGTDLGEVSWGSSSGCGGTG
jgi:hypothetical protein